MTYVPPTPDESEEAMFRSIERGINFDKYDEIPVEVTGRGKESIIPIQSFSQAQLYDTFQQNVKKSNYTKPTPVQKYAIPAILGGRDVMACAQTGSGKTVRLNHCSFFWLYTLHISLFSCRAEITSAPLDEISINFIN